MRILFVVPYAPTVIRCRPRQFIRALAALGHRVTVAAMWTSQDELSAAQELQSTVDSLILEHQSSQRSLTNCLRSLATSDPMQANFSWNPRFLAKIVDELRARPYDIVHVEHLRGVRYGLAVDEMLESLPKENRPTVVWDSVDCISLLFSHASEKTVSLSSRLVAKMELARTKRYEGLVASRFRKVVMTAAADRAALLELVEATVPEACPRFENAVEVVPNGVDLSYFAPRRAEHDPLRIVFSGKMSYHANVTAAVGLVRRIMPQVWEAWPETELVLVGKDPTSTVRRLVDEDPLIAEGRKSRITVTGTVPDLRAYLNSAAVAVAPLPYAVGIQNKVLEAMASAVPVVCSQSAFAALQARSGYDLLVARDDNDTATAILSLLRDPARRLEIGQAGRRFVERTHDWNSAAAHLTRVYEAAIAA